jgi:predicted secreted hydrolase
MTSRRAFAIALLAARAGTLATSASGIANASALRFPIDYGAHRDSRVEWWYLTGALDAAARTWGFQITFFRVPTGVTGADASRFAARELVFAHAAVSDLEANLRSAHRAQLRDRAAAVGDTDLTPATGAWRASAAAAIARAPVAAARASPSTSR